MGFDALASPSSTLHSAKMAGHSRVGSALRQQLQPCCGPFLTPRLAQWFSGAQRGLRTVSQHGRLCPVPLYLWPMPPPRFRQQQVVEECIGSRFASANWKAYFLPQDGPPSETTVVDVNSESGRGGSTISEPTEQALGASLMEDGTFAPSLQALGINPGLTDVDQTAAPAAPVTPQETTPAAREAAGAHVLRPYQQECIDKSLLAFAAGLRRVAVSLPVGAGKTVVFSNLIQQLPVARPGATKTLILAHRRELIMQAQTHVQRIGLRATVAVGTARPDLDADVLVASVQVGMLAGLAWRPMPCTSPPPPKKQARLPI